MSTVSTQVPPAASEQSRWHLRALRQMWASLAIASMWIAVSLCALFGPDFVASSAAGTSTTTIPSGILVAFFAYLGTRVVARYGFRDEAD